jgi:nitrous oxide reductase accessory protein NosL
MRRLLALVVTTVLVAGCGGDEERPQAEATLEKRIAQIDADP